MKRIITLIILILASGLAYGQAGYLDKTFGDGGVVTLNLSGKDITPYDVKVMADGKIIHCGVMEDNGSRIYVMKHLNDGRIDSSFGYQGVNTVLYNKGFYTLYLHVYSDGRLLVYGDQVGNDPYSNVHPCPYIFRFLANGMIDSSFGTNGKYVPGRSVIIGTLKKLRINKDESITVLGSMGTSPHMITGVYSPTITRITSAGIVDTLFGNSGIKTVGTISDTGAIYTAIFYGDEQCIFSYTQYPIQNNFIHLLFANLNGVIDSSFGTNGNIVNQLSDGDDHVINMTINPDGKLICLTQIETTNGTRSEIIGFNKDGTYDNSFGDQGIAPTPTEAITLHLYRLIIDSSMKLIGTGYLVGSKHYVYPVIMRYQLNGMIDSSFDSNGALTEISKYMTQINSLAVQSDGKYIALGYKHSYNGKYIGILCRVHNNSKTRVGSLATNLIFLSLHPTPSTDNCTVTYILPSSGECTMTLRDESGRQIRTFTTNEYRTAGEYKEELDLRGLAAGVYFLQIEANGTVQTAKLIKQ